MSRASHTEDAILNFYKWELRGRGYAFYDTSVALEAPFIPFTPLSINRECVDDGLVPSGWSRIKGALTPTRCKVSRA